MKYGYWRPEVSSGRSQVVFLCFTLTISNSQTVVRYKILLNPFVHVIQDPLMSLKNSNQNKLSN